MIAKFFNKGMVSALTLMTVVFGISLAEFFNNTDVSISMTDDEKNMLKQWTLLTPSQRTAVLNVINLLLIRE